MVTYIIKRILYDIFDYIIFNVSFKNRMDFHYNKRQIISSIAKTHLLSIKQYTYFTVFLQEKCHGYEYYILVTN